jgi:phosphatidylglycerophosphate synthase
MSLRKSYLADLFYRLAERWFLPGLSRLDWTPYHYTIMGLLLAAAVPVGFYLHPFFGLFFIGLSGIADAFDGMVARQQGATSALGAFLDSSLDRISDFFYLCGFWVLFWPNPRLILASLMILVGLLVTEMISYVKARAESLGVSCDCGFMERGWRTIYLILWAFVICVLPMYRPALLWLGLILYLILTSLTVLQRIFHVRAKMTPSGP